MKDEYTWIRWILLLLLILLIIVIIKSLLTGSPQ